MKMNYSLTYTKNTFEIYKITRWSRSSKTKVTNDHALGTPTKEKINIGIYQAKKASCVGKKVMYVDKKKPNI